jgi:hypothetical protein
MNAFVQRFFETIVVNVGVFAAAYFCWGVSGVALFRDFEQYESVVGASFSIVVAGLLFFIFFLFLQLLVFSVLVSIVRRRMLAIACAPLAVGILFEFADYGFGPTLFLAGLTISFGCSAYVSGSPAWWQKKPRRLLWAAAVFAIAFVAIALSQGRASSERTRLVFAVTDGAQRQRFELDCQFNRSGRVRASLQPKGPIPAHPGGRRACEILKSLEAMGDELGSGPLNSGCPQGVALARISGIYRNKRVRVSVSRADAPPCFETWVFQNEVEVLVPRI